MAHPSSHGEHAAHSAPTLNHETTDIPLTGTTRVAIGTLIVLGLTMAVVFGAWAWFESQAKKRDPGLPSMAEKDYGHRLPPVPRIQSTPATDLAGYRAAQNAKLGSYGWVDRATGVVHIPIERAIELTVERVSTIADPQAATAPAAAPAAPVAPVAAPPATPPPAAAGHGPAQPGPS